MYIKCYRISLVNNSDNHVRNVMKFRISVMSMDYSLIAKERSFISDCVGLQEKF